MKRAQLFEMLAALGMPVEVPSAASPWHGPCCGVMAPLLLACFGGTGRK
jgi:hypothetical protein